MSLGARLRQIRKSRNLSQGQLSRRTHIAPSYLSRLENDHIEPSLKTLHKLATALQVQVGDLFEPYPAKFEGKCPVSVSGRCIIDLPSQRRQVRGGRRVETYSSSQIRLLKICAYMIQCGNKSLLDALEYLLLALLNSPHLQQEKKWKTFFP